MIHANPAELNLARGNDLERVIGIETSLFGNRNRNQQVSNANCFLQETLKKEE